MINLSQQRGTVSGQGADQMKIRTVHTDTDTVMQALEVMQTSFGGEENSQCRNSDQIEEWLRSHISTDETVAIICRMGRRGDAGFQCGSGDCGHQVYETWGL